MEYKQCGIEFEQESHENLCPDCLREWQDFILVREVQLIRQKPKAKMTAISLKQVAQTRESKDFDLTLTRPSFEYKVI